MALTPIPVAMTRLTGCFKLVFTKRKVRCSPAFELQGLEGEVEKYDVEVPEDTVV